MTTQTRSDIVSLLKSSKPLTGMQIARKLGVHNNLYAAIDSALSRLELDGLVEYSAAGKYSLTDIARKAVERYGCSGLLSADQYTF